MADNSSTYLFNLERNWVSSADQASAVPFTKIMIRYRSNTLVMPRVQALLFDLHTLVPENWKSDTAASRKIPDWFKNFCTAPLSTDEMNVWLATWRKLPRAEQIIFETEKGWSLQDWLYWMQPENRTWYVVGASEKLGQQSMVSLAVDSWPTPVGAAEWMLRAAGAEAIKVFD